MPRTRWAAIALAAIMMAACGRASAGEAEDVLAVDPGLMRPDRPALKIGPLDAERGRALFVSKGCVICHAVNGVGGYAIHDLGGKAAPGLDAARMPVTMDPFAFFARMWAGAKEMIALQEQKLGYQIHLRGDEIADIMAFIHDPEEQKKFTPESFTPPIFWYRDIAPGEDD
jgi:mono/diheme cytochrome c family protein